MVNCVIMAGGDATRAWPINQIMEKSMLRLGGKPIIRILVDKLLRSGQVWDNTIVCVLGKHIQDFRHEFRDIPRIKFSPKMEATGTASHYYYAAEQEFHFDPEDWVLLHYADCITEIDYKEFIEYANASGKDGCLAITSNAKHDYSEVQSYLSDEHEVVSSIIEKPNLTYPTWTGIAAFKHKAVKNLLGDLLFGIKLDFAMDIWPKLVEKKQLSAYKYNGKWFDTGNVLSYNKLVKQTEGGNFFGT